MAAAISGIVLKSSRSNGLTLVIRSNSVTASKYSTSDGPKRPVAETKPSSYFEPNLSGMKRGTGGRSSFNGVVATVFGSSGLMGLPICNRLGKIGTQVIIPYRGDDYDIRHMKLCGDLGQILFHPFNLKDEESIRKAVKYSNVVVNLIGRDWETKNYTFKDVHVTGARTIARICRESGVKRLIHFSSLNASPHPTPLMLPGGSKILKSKYEGELAVLDEFPGATIFRPADIFGQADRFLGYYAAFWRRGVRTMPLWKKGEQTVKQPVFVSDVAAGVINAIKDPETAGKIYDIVGPKRYRLSELLDYILRVIRRSPADGYKRTELFWDPVLRMKIIAAGLSPSWPMGYLDWEKLEKDHVTDILTPGNPKLEDLGVTLTELESRIEWELYTFRDKLDYMEELGEFAPPAPPKTEPLL